VFLLLASLLMQRVEDPQGVTQPRPAEAKLAASD